MLWPTFCAVRPWPTFSTVMLVALLIVHVAAALKHHFFDKDDVLTRMLPARRSKVMDTSSME